MHAAHEHDSSAAAASELTFASEWTVFGPCSDADSLPAPGDLAACPATLRPGGKELAARRVRASDNGVSEFELLDKLPDLRFVPRLHDGPVALELDGRRIKTTAGTVTFDSTPLRPEPVGEATR